MFPFSLDAAIIYWTTQAPLHSLWLEVLKANQNKQTNPKQN